MSWNIKGRTYKRMLPQRVGAVGAIVAVALLGAACAGTTSATGTTGSTDTTSVSSPPTSGSPAQTQAQQVSDWYSTVQSDLSTLGTDLTAAGTDSTAASTSGDFTTIRADCVTIGTDVQTIQTDPPAPVAAINTPWQAGLALALSASAHCTDGIDQNDPSLLQQMSDELVQATSDFNQVTGQTKALAGG